jgi:hypothetical protein
MRRAFADISADNAHLISELSRLDRGSVATYAEHFSQWLKRPVRNSHDIPNFSTVVRRLRSDYSIVLSVIPGVGYKLLTDEQTVRDDSQLTRSRRAASKRKKELATVDVGKLNDQQRLSHICKLAQAHLIEEAGREKSLQKLASATNGSANPLALTHALDALKKNL